MADGIAASIQIAASALEAQSARVRVIAQNVANAQSTSLQPGGDPYRRQTITFGSEYSRQLDADLLTIRRIGADQGDFPTTYDPSHPAADADGYVKTPNVNPLIESADLREATRAYEANLAVVEGSRELFQQTLDLLSRF